MQPVSVIARFLFLLCAAAFAISTVRAQDISYSAYFSSHPIVIPVSIRIGQPLTVNFDRSLDHISISNEGIAQATLIAPAKVQIYGKSTGQVFLFARECSGDRFLTFHLSVRGDPSPEENVRPTQAERPAISPECESAQEGRVPPRMTNGDIYQTARKGQSRGIISRIKAFFRKFNISRSSRVDLKGRSVPNSVLDANVDSRHEPAGPVSVEVSGGNILRLNEPLRTESARTGNVPASPVHPPPSQPAAKSFPHGLNTPADWSAPYLEMPSQIVEMGIESSPPQLEPPIPPPAAEGRIILPPSAILSTILKADLTPANAAEISEAKPLFALPPEKTLPLHVPRFKARPVIDGKLDDPVWEQAVILKDFYQIEPGDNIPPSKPTEVLLGHDEKYLYIAFRAHDDPGKVRATESQRDKIFDDDNVNVYLDTFNARREAYALFFNPLGVQADAIYSEDGGMDYSVDVVMNSKGVVSEDGYTVEVEIPFESLRYEPGKDKLWGVHFFRTIKRFNDEQDSWLPISREIVSLLDQGGRIDGFENLSAKHTLEIVPSLTLTESGKRARVPFSTPFSNRPDGALTSRFINGPLKGELGLTTKFGITPTTTLAVAFNPDFAELEADQPVVTANQRFPIFFPEKRPFFLDGIDIFQTPLRVVHTRTIIDPDYAVNLTGKRGRNMFGVLLASDAAPGSFSKEEIADPENFRNIKRFVGKSAYIGVLRLKRDVGEDSRVGFIGSSYNFIEKHNQLAGFDGRFRINAQTAFSFQALGTTSKENFFDPELGRNVYRTGNGFGYYWNYDHSGRYFGYNFSGEGYTRDYRADVGFTSRTNTNRESLGLNYRSEPRPSAKLISWNVYNLASLNFDWRGNLQQWYISPQLGLNLRRQSFITVGVRGGYERLFEEEFGSKRTLTRPGSFIGDDPERSTYKKGIYLYGQTKPSSKLMASLSVNRSWGAWDYDFGGGPRFPRVSPAALIDTNAPLDPGPGASWDINASFEYWPTAALSTSFEYTKSRLVRNDTQRLAFEDNIYAFRARHQITRFTFARARIDYDTLASQVFAQFLLGWTPSPGTFIYAGYDDNLNRNGFNPFTGQFEPGFHRNQRTFFVKLSYLFRRSF
jgi:hypothetical protein